MVMYAVLRAGIKTEILLLGPASQDAPQFLWRTSLVRESRSTYNGFPCFVLWSSPVPQDWEGFLQHQPNKAHLCYWG